MRERNRGVDRKKTIDPQLMTTWECAGILNVRRGHVKDMIEKGRLPVVRFGRRIGIDRKDVDRLIEESKEEIA